MLSRKPPKGMQVQSGTQELGRAKAQKDHSRKERGTGNDHWWRTPELPPPRTEEGGHRQHQPPWQRTECCTLVNWARRRERKYRTNLISHSTTSLYLVYYWLFQFGEKERIHNMSGALGLILGTARKKFNN